MKILPILAALTAAASISAQTSVSPQGTLATATGYAVFAKAVAGDADGVPAGTAIGPRGLSIRAAEAAFASSAHAGTSAGFAPTIALAGVHAIAVHEQGGAFSVASRAAGGTSTTVRPANPEAHGLGWALPARAGERARVTVHWQASATAGANSSAVVDVDGDGTPDFASRVSGGRVDRTMSFDVRAGARGFRIGVSTSGLAATDGGREGYDATLNVVVRRVPGCLFRPFGPECGGTLRGAEVGSGLRNVIALGLGGAAPNALAALVIGDPLPAPVQLPNSRCPLLVTPRVLLSGQTDPMGQASWRISLPPLALSTAFQVITVDLSAAGVTLASSNGLGVTCQ